MVTAVVAALVTVVSDDNAPLMLRAAAMAVIALLAIGGVVTVWHLVGALPPVGTITADEFTKPALRP